MKYGVQNGIKQGQYLQEKEKGLFDPKYAKLKSEWGFRGVETQRQQGLGIHGERGQWKETYVENGRVQGNRSYQNKTGLFSAEMQEKIREANKQMWASTIDGFVSTAAGVASHNRSIGGTGKDKVKLTN